MFLLFRRVLITKTLPPNCWLLLLFQLFLFWNIGNFIAEAAAAARYVSFGSWQLLPQRLCAQWVWGPAVGLLLGCRVPARCRQFLGSLVHIQARRSFLPTQRLFRVSFAPGRSPTGEQAFELIIFCPLHHWVRHAIVVFIHWTLYPATIHELVGWLEQDGICCSNIIPICISLQTIAVLHPAISCIIWKLKITRFRDGRGLGQRS